MSRNWPPDFTLSTIQMFQHDFPHLEPTHCNLKEISVATCDYNCVAWAASDDSQWWWPDDPILGEGYWPDGIPREETVPVFIAAFETLHYRKCDDGLFESGFEKIAIYATADGTPTHVARQLPNAQWTTKFGNFEDIQHNTLECLNGPLYGEVAAYMKRSMV